MPDKLVRRFGGRSKAWLVYTKEEADAKGIEYVHWSRAEEGQWCITDDDFVTQLVRKAGPYREHRGSEEERYQVTFPFCRRWLGTQELRYEEYRVSDLRPWLRDELSRDRFRRALRLYASLIITKGYPLSDADMHAVGIAYRPDQKIPAATFSRMMRYQESREMLTKEIENLLEERGINRGKVVDMFKEAFETARETGNSATMRSVAKDLSEMLDMKPEARRSSNNQIPVGDADWSRLEIEDATEAPPRELTE
jgi:hypothetical protein